jgi:hypothetical protein
MSKRIAQPTRCGQLAGAQLKIIDIYNDTLREHVTIINLGTQAQPMGGWVPASLRGEQLYSFPDDLILLPRMRVSIHSGKGTLNDPPHHLFWADAQIWNNRGDVAVLFDANGFEVDRRSYPYKWVRRPQRTTPHRKRLVYDGETWRLVDEPTHQAGEPVRRVSKPA